MIKVTPVAAESLGARSMATFVETPDVKITIDPGVALAPYRSKLPPHLLEVETLKKLWLKIVKFVRISDVIIVTHYHYDHYNPDQVWLFSNKILILKDHYDTNYSQKTRGKRFFERVSPLARDCLIADGKSFQFGDTKIHISKPVSHGPGKRLGKVIQVAIERDSERFLFTSDIQGPSDETHMEFIRNVKPSILYLDGPPFYLLGRVFPGHSYEKFITYLNEIADYKPLRTLIIDHHSLRIKNWRSFLKINRQVKIVSAAEFLGIKETLLEAYRKELYFEKIGIRI